MPYKFTIGIHIDTGMLESGTVGFSVRLKKYVVPLQGSSSTSMLRHYEIQRCVDDVNVEVTAEHNRA